jgi:ribosome-binding factor A
MLSFKKSFAKLIKRRKGTKVQWHKGKMTKRRSGTAAQWQNRYFSFLNLCTVAPLPVLKIIEMESTRQKKVSRLIQKELADIFIKRNNEIAHGKLVSVTTVRVSPDLSFARVFLSIFPNKGQNEVFDLIKEMTPKIRFELGQKVRTQLRIVPEIAFFIDDSLDYIDNIDKLLKK